MTEKWSVWTFEANGSTEPSKLKETENDQIRWAAERKMFWRYIQSSLMAIPPFSWPFVVYEMHPPPFWTKTDEEVQLFFVPQFQSVSFFSGRLGGEPNERAPKRIFFFLQDGWEVKRKKKLQRKGTGKQVMRGLITCFFWLQVFFFHFSGCVFPGRSDWNSYLQGVTLSIFSQNFYDCPLSADYRAHFFIDYFFFFQTARRYLIAFNLITEVEPFRGHFLCCPLLVESFTRRFHFHCGRQWKGKITGKRFWNN